MFGRMHILKTNIVWVWPTMEKREKTKLLKPLSIKHFKPIFGEVPLLVMLVKLFGLNTLVKNIRKIGKT